MKNKILSSQAEEELIRFYVSCRNKEYIMIHLGHLMNIVKNAEEDSKSEIITQEDILSSIERFKASKEYLSERGDVGEF